MHLNLILDWYIETRAKKTFRFCPKVLKKSRSASAPRFRSLASISSRQSVFCYFPGQFPLVLGRFPVGRVCSAKSRVNFRSAECVPPCPGMISGWQSLFHHVPGRFPASRVCSATSWVNFWSAECVPPRPGMISGRQNVFRPHIWNFVRLTWLLTKVSSKVLSSLLPCCSKSNVIRSLHKVLGI